MTGGSGLAADVPRERQLTSSALHHVLDNNDNFSRDGRFLCFDTRDTLGRGPANSTRLLKVDVKTGEETVVYAPHPVIVSDTAPAPGVLAASYSPVADEIAFIHGPPVKDVPRLGPYSRTNRRGAVVPGDGSGKVTWLDARDVTSPVTPPGVHRGGTHRHEYSRDGRRIGFTYDDHLLPQYGRNVGMMTPYPGMPDGATHFTVLLIPLAPEGEAKPGQIEYAAGDSWVDPRGRMRAFIGKVREADGSYTNSLFVAGIPEDVDVTTARAGTREQYPSPPKGVTIRRLTHTEAGGIVRGSPDGTRIAYFAKAPDGSQQVFVIPALGSDRDPDPALRPVQATRLERGATAGLRWHPSGRSIAVISGGALAVVCVQPGRRFGAAHFLTAAGPAAAPVEAPVWSPDGAFLAFNRRVPTFDAEGRPVKDAAGGDFRQIFLVDFPDRDRNGIADPVESEP